MQGETQDPILSRLSEHLDGLIKKTKAKEWHYFSLNVLLIAIPFMSCLLSMAFITSLASAQLAIVVNVAVVERAYYFYNRFLSAAGYAGERMAAFYYQKLENSIDNNSDDLDQQLQHCVIVALLREDYETFGMILRAKPDVILNTHEMTRELISGLVKKLSIRGLYSGGNYKPDTTGFDIDKQDRTTYEHIKNTLDIYVYHLPPAYTYHLSQGIDQARKNLVQILIRTLYSNADKDKLKGKLVDMLDLLRTKEEYAKLPNELTVDGVSYRGFNLGSNTVKLIGDFSQNLHAIRVAVIRKNFIALKDLLSALVHSSAAGSFCELKIPTDSTDSTDGNVEANNLFFEVLDKLKKEDLQSMNGDTLRDIKGSLNRLIMRYTTGLDLEKRKRFVGNDLFIEAFANACKLGLSELKDTMLDKAACDPDAVTALQEIEKSVSESLKTEVKSASDSASYTPGAKGSGGNTAYDDGVIGFTSGELRRRTPR